MHAMLYYNIEDKIYVFKDSKINLSKKYDPSLFRKKSNYPYTSWITDNIKLMKK